MLYCQALFQDDYYDVAKRIEESGLKGVMKVLDGPGVDLLLEGPLASIETLYAGIQNGTLFKTIRRQGCTWIPYRGTYKNLQIQPYLYHASKIRKSGDY